MKSTDKRRGQRLPMVLPVAVRSNGLPKESAAGRTRDVSSGGIYFEFATSLAIGSPVECLLTLPELVTMGKSAEVRLRGRIVRIDDGTKMGIPIGLAATIEHWS